MPKLGVPVSTAPWEAPADDDPQAHWLAGVRPWRLRDWLENPPDRGVARGPREALWRDPAGREWYVRE